MIKFFRHIRKSLIENNQMGNPTSAKASAGKYFKYAIGEILLVVIGILIALQVNNWNEKRKLRTTQKNYLKELSADIDSMKVQYKSLVEDNTQDLTSALEVFNSLKSCELKKEQKKHLDELLISYNSLIVFYQVRDTYEEMLSANILAEIENKKIKTNITEFYAHRDAMQHYIDEYRQDISNSYTIIKKHITFDYNSKGQSIVVYDIAELCESAEFKNAIFEVVRTREYILQMVTILSQRLEYLKQMLTEENTNN